MFIQSGLDEDEASERAAVRVQRQAILDGPDATQVTTIIYEPVLHSLVGTPAVLRVSAETWQAFTAGVRADMPIS